MTATCRWSTVPRFAFTCTGRTQKGVRRSQPGTSLTPMRGALAGRADDQDPRLGRRQRLAGRPEAHPRQAHDGKRAADLLDRLGEEADPAGRPGLPTGLAIPTPPSAEHTSALLSLIRPSYDVFFL